MTSLKLLRPDFVTKDLNRKPLFAYFIPITVALVTIGVLVAIHYIFKVRITAAVTVIAGISMGILTRQLIRLLLPDHVGKKDIIGTIELKDGSIQITRQKENDRLSFEKDGFTVIDFKHHYSRETHLGKKDEDHNGLAELTLESAGKKHAFKFIIQTDEELKDIQKTLHVTLSTVAN
jgi:hypothetical protein